MDYLYYLFVVLAFVAIVLFIEGSYLAWNAYKGPEASRIERRLRTMSAEVHKGEDLSIVKKRLLAEMPELDRLLQEIPRIHHLDRLLLQAGVEMNVAKFLAFTLLLLVGSLLLSVAIGLAPPIALAAVVGCGAIPLLYVLSSKRNRLERFEQQLPDALDLMGRALRAGHAFPGALRMVGDEMPEPVAGEFRTTFDELNYGISMQDALQNMAVRVPGDDLRYFVVAVLIQRETGGNLAELLNSISTLIRARLNLLGTVRVLSAEGRLSAWILGLLPLVLGLYMNVVNSKMMSLLWTDPLGKMLLWGALVNMIVGALWMRRIIRIHV